MSPLPQVYRLTVSTDIYQLNRVQEWFAQFQSVLPYHFWMQCNLVLVEAFSNAVDHAHQDLPPSTPIDIEFRIGADAVELWICDHGKPFDLNAQLEISLKRHASYETIDDIPTGGRGLIIAHRIADSLRYERQPDQRNCFIFVKRLPENTRQGMPKVPTMVAD